ncbi:glycosyl hydrolase 115 family protein [Sphingobium sp. ba1]|uniref:glycosyl hydrolase 115 family protein n=1 Tax=Sphingobium sp. ba1 TaxID=1522072 RepID=UPI000560D5B8|nr:glycosyl hydrolase 115 family protein [Sphingobium sp. ba1]
MSEAIKPVTRRSLLNSVAGIGVMLASPFAAVMPTALAATTGDGRAFHLIDNTIPATILVDAKADSAVLRAADSFAGDLYRVSGRQPVRAANVNRVSGPLVVIGVLNQCPIIDQLVASGKIDASDLSGEWEAFRQIVVDRPFVGVSQALIIVGADRRGAVFGTYDLSERMGVSPWHWFADVPVAQRRTVLIPAGSRRDQPKVRYRGFFINDEDPNFSGWAVKKFGGINAAMYAHVFELLLRMKGNYLWPAMWSPKAFAADDPDNMILADAMGVVMGSSHHEVMMRAQDEWHRNTEKGVTGGAWNYADNAQNLRTFWRGGIERMVSKGRGQSYESVVTIGMRGDGDEAMAEGTATGLLERIVTDQRAIIAQVTGKPAQETPQVWALYKEVQDYYDHGMKVPDDVTLLFADDNWGQIRRLPALGSPQRSGGAGVYYHFDYVGVPRNYKWLNTNQIEKIWQQMNLAYERGARAMWIANVGDIKPMEYPLGFFLAMAWNPDAMTPAMLAAYPAHWAAATFGDDHASAIGGLVTRYSQYAARRKPELIDQDSFSIGAILPEGLDGGEFGAMVAEWDALESQMLDARGKLPPNQYDAYYQLVEFPISAVANLYRLYYGTAWNRKLASRNDARANIFADQVEAAFARDAALTRQYHAINGCKWDGMMTQVHMSYVIWNDPTQQTMPSITRVAGDTPTDKRGSGVHFIKRAAGPKGVIAIEAPAFARSYDRKGLGWATIPHLGRTDGAVLALPQGRPATAANDGVRLEYDVQVTEAGPASLTLILAPTLDTSGSGGVRIGVSLDDGPVQTLVAALEATGGAQDTPGKQRWAKAVCDNEVRLSADMGQLAPGKHVIKVWRLDDNAVLQKLILATVAVPDSYLGPVPV